MASLRCANSDGRRGVERSRSVCHIDFYHTKKASQNQEDGYGHGHVDGFLEGKISDRFRTRMASEEHMVRGA